MKLKFSEPYRLYLITDRKLMGARDLLACLREAIKGGVTMIQLREKDASTKEFYEWAAKVKELTMEMGIPLIINDRVDIAQAVDAEGVHLGREDMPLPIARQILGNNKLIGTSAATREEADRAVEAGADYIGAGALYPSSTKFNTRSVSVEGLRDIKAHCRIPVVAIGGIHQSNVHTIRSTGVDGVAVVSAILGRTDVRAAAQEMRGE